MTQEQRDELTRRRFVQQIAGAAGGMLLSAGVGLGQGAPPADQIRNYVEGMEYRRLGRSGLWCSHLGLGGHHLSGDQEMRNQVVAKALELGINYFDTTGDNEAIELGLSLEACGGRGRAYIVRDFLQARDPNLRQAPEAEYKRVVREHFQLGLEQLRTNYVDVFRMTPPEGNPPEWPMEEFHNVHWFAQVFEELKAAGQVGSMGLSTHNPEFNARAVREVPQLDLVYLPYNYVFSGAADRLYDFAVGEGTLFEFAHAQDKGIVTIKPFMKTTLFSTEAFQKRFDEQKRPADTPTAFALRYVLANPDITVTIPGMDTPEHVAANVAALRAGALTAAEYEALTASCAGIEDRLPAEYAWAHLWRA